MPKAQTKKPPIHAVTPKPETMSNGNVPNVDIINKKIQKQRVEAEKQKKSKGETIFFEHTQGNSTRYALKGEHIIYIPEDWKENTELKEYMSEIFSEKEMKTIPTGEQTLRLVRGQKTIFASLQSSAAEKKKTEMLEFTSGVRGYECNLICNSNKNKNEMAMCMLHNRNASNPFRDGNKTSFKQISKTKQATADMEVKRARYSALSWAMERPEPEIMTVAAIINADTSEAEIMRNEVIEYAMAHPVQFNVIVNDSLLPIKSMYILAKNAGILKYDNNTVKMADNGTVLQFIPKGRTDLEIMSEWMDSDDGRATYELMVKLLNG